MGEIFDKAEELENQDTLFLMFHFFKGALSLGDSKLIETLLSKDFFMTTLGALECMSYHIFLILLVDDPEVMQSPTFRHEDEINGGGLGFTDQTSV